jgi:hypothetical protein
MKYAEALVKHFVENGAGIEGNDSELNLFTWNDNIQSFGS